MQKTKLLIAVGVLAGTLALSSATPAAAWHPKGAIVKKVQNQTTNSQLSDANSVSSAVASKPGDVLRYVIEVRNDGAAASNGYNDMAKTVMTDTLPAGVELVSNPAQREIKVDLGTLKPGQKVTKEYLVKVTSTKDGAVVENKACFTGDSKVYDAPQKGCDVAITKVTVPKQPPKEEKPPVVPPKQEEPKVEGVQDVPAELPATGPEAILSGFAGAGALGYGVHAYLRSKRELSKKLQ